MKHDYLMTQRLRCGHCNTRLVCHMQRQREKVYKYYHCANRSCSLSYWNVDRTDSMVWEWVKSVVLTPEKLTTGAANYLADREREAEPLHAQLKITEDLIAEHKGQLARLLDLYLSNQFDRSILVERKERLESTIEALRRQHLELAESLQALTPVPEFKPSIEAFTAEVMEGLRRGETEFTARRQLIELLNVTGSVKEENGERILDVHCALGRQVLLIATTTTCGSGQNPVTPLVLNGRLKFS